ncbi:uncharacterized protein LOC128993933 isoform X2 [Macrosteles quadrilineatus]|uniref:uncharacterized protein LOC128993933 isoform X2 n=1 Tax=Macrosteles quadrilineatus TaxID=74068 RepID=UPI0023E2602C|nr:uncharacterized protein LOC128993933 isoform X2 [Macrosteles quadrilineatus]
MKIFNHILGIVVLTFLVWETVAELQEVTVDLMEGIEPYREETVKRYLRGKETWAIEVDEVKTQSDFESRHEKYKNKVLAIYAGNQFTDQENVDSHCVIAARELARYDIKNGVFLYLPSKVISADYEHRNKIHSNYLWFELKDKDEYEKMISETYKGPTVVYTFIHDFDPDCLQKNSKGVDENCLEMESRTQMNRLKMKFDPKYTWVVLLVVHVDILGEEYAKELCRGRREPHAYPMVYRHNESGKVIEVIGGYADWKDGGAFIWSCSQISSEEESSTNT